MTDTQQSEVERVARAIATAEVFMPDEALVIVGMKTIPTWQSRLPHARAAIAALRPKVSEAEVREVLGNIFAELDNGRSAPGHGHNIPGVWDDDISNGEKAGKPCEWCAQWEATRSLLDRLNQGEGQSSEQTRPDCAKCGKPIIMTAHLCGACEAGCGQ